MKFNTAVSALMTLANRFGTLELVRREDWERFLLLLAPFAPAYRRRALAASWTRMNASATIPGPYLTPDEAAEDVIEIPDPGQRKAPGQGFRSGGHGRIGNQRACHSGSWWAISKAELFEKLYSSEKERRAWSISWYGKFAPKTRDNWERLLSQSRVRATGPASRSFDLGEAYLDPRLSSGIDDGPEDRSERLFRHLFEHSPDPGWLIDGEVFVDCNRAAVSAMGYDDREGLLSRHPSQLSPPVQSDGMPSEAKASAMIQIANERGVHRFNWEHLKANGENLPVEVTLARIRLGAKDLLYCTWRDISDRKRTERALRESEEKFRAIFNQTFQFIGLLSPAGVLLDANDSALTFAGVSRSDVLGRPFWETPWWAYDPNIQADLHDAIRHAAAGEFVRFESTHIDLSGAQRSFDVSITPILNDAGEVVFLLPEGRDITEIQKAREEVMESYTKYRALFVGAQDAILMLSGDTIVDCNPTAVFMLGLPRDELIGKSLLYFGPGPEVISHSQPNRLRQRIDAASGGNHQFFETVLQKATGEIINTEISMTSVEVLDVHYLQALVRDVTRRHRMDQARRESEDMLRAVLDTIPVRVFWKDRESRFLGCNVNFTRDAGLKDAREIVGKSDAEMTWKDQASRYQADDREIMTTGQPKLSYEEVQPRSDGSYSWIRTWKIPLRSSDGQVIGILGCYDDITESKADKEALEESERKYRSLVELTNTGFAIFEQKSGLISDANNAFAEMAGAPGRDRWTGQSFWSLLSSTDQARCRSAIQTSDRTGPIRGLEMEFQHPEGPALPIEMDAQVVTMPKGRQILALVRDISEKRERDQRLRQQQKLEAIGTLAGGIAHDFNNILSVIIGNTELAIDEGVEPESQTYQDLQMVLRAAERAKALVAQILTFSRKGALDRRPLNPESAVREAIKLLRATLPTTIEFQKEIVGPIPSILGDPTEIHQLIVNLGTNAAHAMEASGGVMTIRLSAQAPRKEIEDEESAERSENVILEVEDTGCGIPPHLIDRIFDPFFTTKDPGKGTGLGLSVVQGIIQSVGGQIEVQSQVGEGTRVCMTIPAAPTQNELFDPQNYEAYPVGTETILFVDDEIGLVNFGQKFLRRLGYQVITATNGQEATEVLARMRDTIQLVISDQTMPGMTGLELARQIRATNPELPIILCTGAPNETLTRAAAEIGVAGLIPKPYDTRILARTVREQFDKVRRH